MRRSGTITAPTGFGPGDHSCWVYGDRAEWVSVAATFLREGLAAGERALYVADGGDAELMADMAVLPDRDALLASGHLEIAPHREVYGDPQRFVAEDQVADLRDRERAAVAAGHRGLRIAAEVSRLTDLAGGRGGDLARFTGYELLADRAIAEGRVTSMCGFARARLHPPVDAALSFVHPLRHPLLPDTSVPAGRCWLHADAGGHWRLSGDLDAGCAGHVMSASGALRGDCGDVHLDLERLRFVDIAGVQALLELAARAAPGDLVLHHPPSLPAHLLRTLSVHLLAGTRVVQEKDTVTVSAPLPEEEAR